MSRVDRDPASEYPPFALRQYALLADGERGILVGPRGDFAWMCAPRWDSGAVFSTLIGGQGVYGITPVGRFVWGGYYEEGTLIWRSRWITETGIVECREALALPADPERAVILRRLVALDADAKARVLLNPRAGFGSQHLHDLVRGEDGVWSGSTGELRMSWSGGQAATPCSDGRGGQHLVLETVVPAGRQHDFVLALAERNATCPDASAAWRATEQAWAAAVPPLSETLVPRETRHSYAVLRGLTSSSGGMVAAATLGLPERAEQGRNYDYRYVWIRDQCYAGQAIAAVGPYPLLDDAVRFVAERLLADGPKMAPAYTTVAGQVPDQHELEVPGYPGGRGIVGNWVNKQFQLDTFGEALLLLAAAARHDRLDAEGWKAVEVAAKVVARRWTEPDAGIWELDDRAWTHSRLMCVAGLRAAARLGIAAAQSARWDALADAILTDTAASSTHASGRWQRAPGDARLDAALLLPPLRGALRADEPRTVATLRAYQAELTEDGYGYRFRHDDRPLGKAEGAFLLCGFVMALAQHQQGTEVAAHRWFERTCAAWGSPGLYSEEFDVGERQLRGNLPQAFVHALMVEASARLTRPWPGGDA